MNSLFDKLMNKALKTKNVSDKDALKLYEEGKKDPFGLMARASKIREHFKGNAVNLCGIVNAKKGSHRIEIPCAAAITIRNRPSTPHAAKR